MANLKVTFTTDSTGMSKDETIVIPLKKDVLLYDYHAEGLNKSNNLYGIVWTALGYPVYLTIWKIHIEEPNAILLADKILEDSGYDFDYPITREHIQSLLIQAIKQV